MFEATGKYRLDGRLGGGGMAEVFVAQQLGAEGFAKKVAIKRILPGFSDNPAFAQMFVDEARISSRLVHPHIVQVLDFDRDLERRLFLVMELVEGKDLDALVQSGLLPIPVVVYAIMGVLRGLGYAHDLPVSSDIRGVVHRDVSPHNVLLSWAGEVKVSDFGIAKARAASEATASVFIKGKPAYMSPEQANGDALDGRSDLFAVGIMLWEMLIGRRLFVAEDTRSTLAAVLFGQIPKPRSLRPEVPKDLERVVMKMLERDLPARYPTAEAVIDDLRKCDVAASATSDALVACLRERFPTQVPMKHSMMRGLGAPAPGPASPTAPTMASMSPTGLGELREATTSSRRAKRIAIAAAVALIGGGLGVGLVAGLKGSSKGAVPVDAPPPPALDAKPDAPIDAAIDAPMDAPIDAPRPIDAHPIDSRSIASRPDAPIDAGTGYVKVTSFMGNQVDITIDGNPHGSTPSGMIPVSVGKHMIVLTNTEVYPKINEVRSVDVHKNETVPVEIHPK